MTPLEALRRTIDLLGRSEESLWAGEPPADISAELERALSGLERGEPVDRRRLRVLFAPTGAVQEIALANGWGDAFLGLAAAVDALTGEE